MALRKHRLALGLAALAGSAAMLAVTAPAQAAPASGRPGHLAVRPVGVLHLPRRAGRRCPLLAADGASDLGVLAGGLNDHVWSVKNISGSRWCLYKDADYENEIQVILDGQAIDLASPVRDQVSSVAEC